MNWLLGWSIYLFKKCVVCIVGKLLITNGSTVLVATFLFNIIVSASCYPIYVLCTLYAHTFSGIYRRERRPKCVRMSKVCVISWLKISLPIAPKWFQTFVCLSLDSKTMWSPPADSPCTVYQLVCVLTWTLPIYKTVGTCDYQSIDWFSPGWERRK